MNCKKFCFFFFIPRELADLHKANATKDSEAQEAALSREMKAKEELGLALEKAQDEARQQQETLAIQVGLKCSEYNFFIKQMDGVCTWHNEASAM